MSYTLNKTHRLLLLSIGHVILSLFRTRPTHPYSPVYCIVYIYYNLLWISHAVAVVAVLSIHEYSVQSRKRIRISDFHNYLKSRNVVMERD